MMDYHHSSKEDEDEDEDDSFVPESLKGFFAQADQTLRDNLVGVLDGTETKTKTKTNHNNHNEDEDDFWSPSYLENDEDNGNGPLSLNPAAYLSHGAAKDLAMEGVTPTESNDNDNDNEDDDNIVVQNLQQQLDDAAMAVTTVGAAVAASTGSASASTSTSKGPTNKSTDAPVRPPPSPSPSPPPTPTPPHLSLIPQSDPKSFSNSPPRPTKEISISQQYDSNDVSMLDATSPLKTVMASPPREKTSHRNGNGNGNGNGNNKNKNRSNHRTPHWLQPTASSQAKTPSPTKHRPTKKNDHDDDDDPNDPNHNDPWKNGRKELTTPDKTLPSRLLQGTSATKARRGPSKEQESKIPNVDANANANRKRETSKTKTTTSNRQCNRLPLQSQSNNNNAKRDKMKAAMLRAKQKREQLQQAGMERQAQLEKQIQQKEQRAQKQLQNKMNKKNIHHTKKNKNNNTTSHQKPPAPSPAPATTTIPVPPKFHSIHQRQRQRQRHQQHHHNNTDKTTATTNKMTRNETESSSTRPLARADDVFKGHLRGNDKDYQNHNHNPHHHMTTPRSLTIPKAPKFSTGKRRQRQPHPNGDDATTTMPAEEYHNTHHLWEQGLRNNTISYSTSSPSVVRDDRSAISSSSTTTMTVNRLTVPQTPQFNTEQRSRSRTKIRSNNSTAEKEEQQQQQAQMDSQKGHPFHARSSNRSSQKKIPPKLSSSSINKPTSQPRHSISTPSSPFNQQSRVQHFPKNTKPQSQTNSTKRLTQQRKVTTPEPFHFHPTKRRQSEEKENKNHHQQQPQQENDVVQFKARPMPDFTRHTGLAFYGSTNVTKAQSTMVGGGSRGGGNGASASAGAGRRHHAGETTTTTTSSSNHKTMEQSSQFRARKMPNLNRISIPVRQRSSPSPKKEKPTTPKSTTGNTTTTSSSPLSNGQSQTDAKHAVRTALGITTIQQQQQDEDDEGDTKKSKPPVDVETTFVAKPAPKRSPPNIPVRKQDPSRLRPSPTKHRDDNDHDDDDNDNDNGKVTFKARQMPTFYQQRRRRRQDNHQEEDTPSGKSNINSSPAMEKKNSSSKSRLSSPPTIKSATPTKRHGMVKEDDTAAATAAAKGNGDGNGDTTFKARQMPTFYQKRRRRESNHQEGETPVGSPDKKKNSRLSTPAVARSPSPAKTTPTRSSPAKSQISSSPGHSKQKGEEEEAKPFQARKVPSFYRKRTPPRPSHTCFQPTPTLSSSPSIGVEQDGGATVYSPRRNKASSPRNARDRLRQRFKEGSKRQQQQQHGSNSSSTGASWKDVSQTTFTSQSVRNRLQQVAHVVASPQSPLSYSAKFNDNSTTSQGVPRKLDFLSMTTTESSDQAPNNNNNNNSNHHKDIGITSSQGKNPIGEGNKMWDQEHPEPSPLLTSQQQQNERHEGETVDASQEESRMMMGQTMQMAYDLRRAAEDELSFHGSMNPRET